MFVTIYVLYITSFGVSLVTEREKKLKYSLNVMGLRVIPYWLGNFLFDFMILTLMLILFISLSFIFDNISNWNALYVT